MIISRSWRAIGTAVHILVAPPADHPDPEALADHAAALVATQLDELDAVCSRFRPDSETNNLPTGTAVPVSPALNRVLAAGIRAARRTDGLVDFTVGRAMSALGYDDDLEQLRARPDRRPAESGPAPGYWRVLHDEVGHQVLVPHGVRLDFGASAKAYAADRAARSLAAVLPGSFCVNLGGDLAIAGSARATGWRIGIDDGTTDAAAAPVITVRAGGIATSSTALRTWSMAGASRVGTRRAVPQAMHHIVDPRTGQPAESAWRAVTVAAKTCELANAAATAAIVLNTDAAPWLARRGFHARLVSHEGSVVYVGDWPADRPAESAVAA